MSITSKHTRGIILSRAMSHGEAEEVDTDHPRVSAVLVSIERKGHEDTYCGYLSLPMDIFDRSETELFSLIETTFFHVALNREGVVLGFDSVDKKHTASVLDQLVAVACTNARAIDSGSI